MFPYNGMQEYCHPIEKKQPNWKIQTPYLS